MSQVGFDQRADLAFHLFFNFVEAWPFVRGRFTSYRPPINGCGSVIRLQAAGLNGIPMNPREDAVGSIVPARTFPIESIEANLPSRCLAASKCLLQHRPKTENKNTARRIDERCFAYKCHRIQNQVRSATSMGYCPNYGTGRFGNHRDRSVPLSRINTCLRRLRGPWTFSHPFSAFQRLAHRWSAATRRRWPHWKVPFWLLWPDQSHRT